MAQGGNFHINVPTPSAALPVPDIAEHMGDPLPAIRGVDAMSGCLFAAGIPEDVASFIAMLIFVNCLHHHDSAYQSWFAWFYFSGVDSTVLS